LSPRPPSPPLFPYTTLFRSVFLAHRSPLGDVRRAFIPRRNAMVVWDADNAAHLVSRAGFGGDERDVLKYVRYGQAAAVEKLVTVDRKSTRLNSSHLGISYAV